ncbi:MAG: urease accessory protein UreF [Candidatus Latescibacteria bacterium]|nr:urease accessory protein UreF [Candidatus Latescibacterota bacterium]
MNRLYHLLHLADSALPAGGYAFSSGLEGAYQLGLLDSPSALEEFIQSALTAAGQGEIPFIHSCYRDLDDDNVAAMLHFYDAMQTAPAMRRASLTLGKNWLRLLIDLYPQAKLAAWRRQLAQKQCPAHYTPVFGLALKAAGFTQVDAQELFIFQVLRDQMSAAVRLGIIGPMEATRRQLNLYAHGERVLAEVAGRPYKQASRCAPQLDIAQAVHDDLYSRLFQS